MITMPLLIVYKPVIQFFGKKYSMAPVCNQLTILSIFGARRAGRPNEWIPWNFPRLGHTAYLRFQRLQLVSITVEQVHQEQMPELQ